MTSDNKRKIEEDINRFDTSRQRALVNLIYTNGFLMDRMNELFRQHNISKQQFNILRLLRLHHPYPLTQTYIKANVVEKMPDIPRIIERMRMNKLVEKGKRAQDLRNVFVTITDKGINIVETIYHQQKNFDELMACLNEEEVIFLNNILNKIRNNIP